MGWTEMSWGIFIFLMAFVISFPALCMYGRPFIMPSATPAGTHSAKSSMTLDGEWMSSVPPNHFAILPAMFCTVLYSDDVFYVVFANIDNDYITINKQVGVSEIKRYTLGWVLNITNDKLNDIILREEDREFYNYYLYRYFKGSNEYQRILPNE